MGVLAWVGEPARWPPAESPPQQGEAAAGVAAPTTHAAPALARLIREPQNTWSNLAFVAGGAWLAVASGLRLARGAGVALIAVGIGSFLYHASAARELRQVDVAAMYWLFLVSAALCAAVVGPRWGGKLEERAGWVLALGVPAAVALMAARNVAVAGVQPFSLRVATVLAAAVILVSLALVARRRESVSVALQFLGVVTLFGVAVALQTADRPGGKLFRPGALVQAHAAWHVLAAVVMVWAVRLLDREGGKDAGRHGRGAETSP